MKQKRNSTKQTRFSIYETSGDHLAPEVKDGDKLLVHHAKRTVKSGDLAVLETLDGQALIRRVHFAGDYIVLFANRKTVPLVYAAANIKIVGRVVYAQRRNGPRRYFAESPSKHASTGNKTTATKLRTLRDRLDKLSAEDDQILRCSERFRIEKQIYDLEHTGDTSDWSEWEEEGEEN